MEDVPDPEDIDEEKVKEQIIDMADAERLKNMAQNFPRRSKQNLLRMIKGLPTITEREKKFRGEIKDCSNADELCDAIDRYVDGY